MVLAERVQKLLKTNLKTIIREECQGASADLRKGNDQLRNSMYSMSLFCNKKEREREKHTDHINTLQYISSVYHQEVRLKASFDSSFLLIETF